MDLDVFFAGTGGSVPTARRGMPALLVRRGGDRLLFDCGEGTQRQLVRSVGLPEVDEVLITHFHADHWLGLPGMLKTFDLRGRERPLTVRGPRGLGDLMKIMQRAVYGRLRYELAIEEMDPGDEVHRDGYTLAAVGVEHRIPAVAWVLWEDERPGEFDAAQAESLGVAPGPDFGRLQRGETVGGVGPDQVVGPPRAGRKLLVSGDTAPCESVRVAAHGADVLVHEATFTEEERERAAQTGHSTAGDAAALARDAEVRLLALTHVSTRYGGREIRDEARAVFERTVVPRDFDAIAIPFPERGEPTLMRHEEPVAG
ncbi:MAG TPA: ribonuclease Z [Solirubrobacteraceae bacterium]|jgi:ribonuclease Z|nr:ribonuclease Z [Solirubrobacteraceae bacterium]